MRELTEFLFIVWIVHIVYIYLLMSNLLFIFVKIVKSWLSH